MNSLLQKLDSKEYAPYYKTYLENLEDDEIVEMMINDLESQITFLDNIPDEKLLYSYDKGKWTISELILHISDCELVFAFRALSFSRFDKTNLTGFDHNEWVSNSHANSLSKKQLIGIFKTARNHSIALFKSFNDKQLNEIGIANNVNFSVRALGYIIIGHNRHHFSILKSRYLKQKE